MRIDQTKPQHTRTHGTVEFCVLLTLALLAILSFAQTPGKAPTVTMAAIPLVTAQRAHQTMVTPEFPHPAGLPHQLEYAQVRVPDSNCP